MLPRLGDSNTLGPWSVEMEIRQVSQDEFSEWLPLWQGYLTFYESQLDKTVTEQTWARFFDDTEPMFLIGAYDDTDQMIGFVSYIFHRSTWSDGPYCYLEDLFVSPDVRGCGAGGALIDAVAIRAKAANCSRLYWHTHENNTVARRLYDKVAALSGFVQYRKPLA